MIPPFSRRKPWVLTTPPGIIHKSRPIFGTQFHPEARGGPLDSSYLFDAYLESVANYKKNQAGLGLKKEGRPSPLLVDLLAKERVGVVPEGVIERTADGAMAASAA